VTLLGLPAFPLMAQPVGTLDTLFGEGGWDSLPLPASTDAPLLLASQASGRLLTGSSTGESWVLLGRTAQGQPDPYFGNFGQVTLPVKGPLMALMVLPDERLLLAGASRGTQGQDLLVMCLQPDGQLDTRFGTEGRFYGDWGAQEVACALALSPEGDLVVAGETFREDWASRDFFVMRLTTDGQEDTGFGLQGHLYLDAGKHDHCTGLAVDTTGSILLAGTSRRDRFTEGVLIRLTNEGRRDHTFGYQGIHYVQVGLDNTFVVDLEWLPDGRMLWLGHARLIGGNHSYDWFVQRFLPEGQLDPTFGNQGTFSLDLGGPEYAADLLRQPDGQLLVAGTINYYPAVMRLKEQGSLDLSFGQGGYQLLDQHGGQSSDWASGLLLGEQGQPFLIGSYEGNSLLARLHGNPYFENLDAVLNVDWQAAPRQARLTPSKGFELSAWMDQSPALLAPRGATFRSGSNSMSRVIQQAYLRIGENFRLTTLWDKDGNAHFYINEKYTRSAGLSGNARPMSAGQSIAKTDAN